MMTTRESTQGGQQQPLQVLLVGVGEQAELLQDFLRAHSGLADANVDQADGFDDAQANLAQKVYDLVLFAEREPETETARMIQELQLQGKRMPLLFLSGDLTNSSGAQPPKGRHESTQRFYGGKRVVADSNHTWRCGSGTRRTAATRSRGYVPNAAQRDRTIGGHGPHHGQFGKDRVCQPSV